MRQNEEQKRKHEEAIKKLLQDRQADLVKAAEWWHLHEATLEFIENCEKRWREKQSELLTSEQADWLKWARQVAATLSPFDPTKDGVFDPTVIPFGGPYLAVRNFPQPHGMDCLRSTGPFHR